LEAGREAKPSPSTCTLLPRAKGSLEHTTSLYLSLGIDISLVLQQKLHQLDVPIVAGHMQRSIAHLKDKIRSQPVLRSASGPAGLGILAQRKRKAILLLEQAEVVPPRLSPQQ